MAERTPTPYLVIAFMDHEAVEDCLRSAYSLSRRLNVGIHFTQQGADWMLQPWQSWDDVKQTLADIRQREEVPGD